MKTTITAAGLFAMLVLAGGAPAAQRHLAAGPVVINDGFPAKASVDTIDLMGPGGIYPYRGDFETAAARPGGAGFLPDGWYSVDHTAPPNHWHVETFAGMDSPYAPLAGARSAWCGERGIVSCGAGDPEGGYGNDWRDILEFRKAVSAAPHTVRVQATLRHDSEPGYDYTTLQRRTSAAPGFEPVAAGQGLSWDGAGVVNVDYTFTYAPAELPGGDEVVVAFIFDSDGAWSDSDCWWRTAGATVLDDVTVTIDDAQVYSHDFEDGTLGPDWTPVANVGVGDFARVWQVLGDADDCASNYSKLVAFIDDGLVVPGTGGTIGGPGMDYGPLGGYIVNNTGGLLGPEHHLQVSVCSPVMDWPDPDMGGMTLAFDLYRHELLTPNDSPGIFAIWEIRSAAAGQDITVADWRSRNWLYYGGPNYSRSDGRVDDLLVPNPAQVQVSLGVWELGWIFGLGSGTNGTPAPYYDNVRVKVCATTGARFVANWYHMAQDAFPAIGDIDLGNLDCNSIRFDRGVADRDSTAAMGNKPRDAINLEVFARPGGTMNTPLMHWTYAVKNPLFDPYRVQADSPVSGWNARHPSGEIQPNSWNFDLPDTGLVFPGDVIHYYFEATDNVAGDVRTAYFPQDRSQYGNPEPLAYPVWATMSGLPSLRNAAGTQPRLLFWNDGNVHMAGEWFGALRSLGLVPGVDYDVYDTNFPSTGGYNGLGARATVSQIAGYTDMLYACGSYLVFTLMNQPGADDTNLLNQWFALGGRDLFMTGDNLASDLYASTATNRGFLETRMGLVWNDRDVRDNIAGQMAPLVVSVAGNPVFTTVGSWVAYGGCIGVNTFDNVVASAGAVRLAQFASPGGLTTPYPYAAATLNISPGNNRVVSLDHDLTFVWDPRKSPSPLPARAILLSNVLDFFGVSNDPGNTTGADVPAKRFGVECRPNPFNPRLTISYTLKGPGNVVMKVYNVRGELVKTLLDARVAETTGAVVWDGTNEQGGSAGSGVYFVETRSGGEVDVRKATLVR